MKKSFITNKEYGPLAEEIWHFLAAKYKDEPTPEQFTVIIGAMEAIKYGITKHLESKGHRVMTMEINRDIQ